MPLDMDVFFKGRPAPQSQSEMQGQFAQASLANMHQRQGEQQMQQQGEQYRAQQADEQAMRDMSAQANGDPAVYQQLMAKRNLPGGVALKDTWAKSALANQKTEADIKKEKMAAAETHVKINTGLMDEVHDFGASLLTKPPETWQTDWAAWRPGFEARSEAVGNPIKLPPTPPDRSEVIRQMAQAKGAKAQVEHEWELTKEDAKRQDTAATNAQFSGATPTQLPGGGTGFMQTNKLGATRVAPGGFSPIPKATAGDEDGTGDKYGDKVGDEFLAALPPAEQNELKNMALGKMGTVDQLKRTKPGQELLKKLMRAGGSVADIGNAVEFSKNLLKTAPGTAGGTVVSVNKQMGGHTNSALDILESKFSPPENPEFNYYQQKAANEWWAFRNPSLAKVGREQWNREKRGLIDEYKKSVLGGKPSVEQSEYARELESAEFTDPKAQKVAMLKAGWELSKGQYGAIETQRQQAQGRWAGESSLLDTKTQTAINRLHKYYGEPEETFIQQAAPTTQLGAASPFTPSEKQQTITAQNLTTGKPAAFPMVGGAEQSGAAPAQRRLFKDSRGNSRYGTWNPSTSSWDME